MDEEFWKKYPDPPPRRGWLAPRTVSVLVCLFTIMGVLVKCRLLIGDAVWWAQH